MQRKPSGTLILVLLCGVTHSTLPLAHGTTFVGQIPQGGTIELVGITYYPFTHKSQWWRPDGTTVNLAAAAPKHLHD